MEVKDEPPAWKKKRVGTNEDRKDEDVVAEEFFDDDDGEDEVAVAPSGGEMVDDGVTGKLKDGHESLPIWVTGTGHVYLEAFSPAYKQAYDLLIAISDPVCRQRYVQEYQINRSSLFGAVSIGLTAEAIVKALSALSKTELPRSVIEYIVRNASSYGKVKLVLRKNRYFLESKFPDVVRSLQSDPVISDAWIRNSDSVKVQQAVKSDPGNDDPDNDDDDDNDDAGHPGGKQGDVSSFEVDIAKIGAVRKRCIEIGLPTLEEYDFRNDTSTPNLAIELRPTTVIRPYQEKSLSKMFGNGRARSGLIVLACGAGKTLVGITATCTIKKVSVEQWRHQYKLWSTVQDSQISRFTSELKDGSYDSDFAGVTITTYSMVAFTGKRSNKSLEIIEKLRQKEWGLVLLDEVHVVPAKMFRKVLEVVAAHCKLGLTATLVREDNLIEDLNFLIGPKLYEANWIDLVSSGFLANVQCIEVWCTMPELFYKQYLATDNESIRRMLYVMNPTKFRCCEFLIRFHEERGDKIIVFSDNVWSLRHYAVALKKPFIYGPTSQAERLDLLNRFQKSPDCRTLFISRVGDNSIDLPEANVIIQISSHFGSRRQEAQRLGRILRPKAKVDGTSEFNAFFYTLVSTDTSEMFFSAKRQQFLIDQGYSFKVVTDLVEKNSGATGITGLHYETEDEMRPLLSLVLEAATNDESAAGIEDLGEDLDDVTGTTRNPMMASRAVGSFAKLSGGAGRTYAEYKKDGAQQQARQKAKRSSTAVQPLFPKIFGKKK